MAAAVEIALTPSDSPVPVRLRAVTSLLQPSMLHSLADCEGTGV